MDNPPLSRKWIQLLDPLLSLPYIQLEINNHLFRSIFDCFNLLWQDETTLSIAVVGGNCGPWISTVEVLDLESNEWIDGPELPMGIGGGSLVEDHQGNTISILVS